MMNMNVGKFAKFVHFMRRDFLEKLETFIELMLFVT